MSEKLEILQKPNAIITGRYKKEILENLLEDLNLSKEEHSIFNRILFSVQKNRKNNSEIYKGYITREDFKNIYDSERASQTKIIKKVLDRLVTYRISYSTKEFTGTTLLVTGWERNKKTDIYTCNISDRLYNLVIDPKTQGGFSTINIARTEKAKGDNSAKLYELLRMLSWNKNTINYNFEQLKIDLGVEDRSSYRHFSEFKRCLLIPSIAEIGEKFNMGICFEEVKYKRKVQEIIFTINDREPRNYDFKKGDFTTEPVIDVNYIDIHNQEEEEEKLLDPVLSMLKESRTNISANTVDSFKKAYGEEEVKLAVKILVERKKTTKISAPKKYLEGILINNRDNAKNKPTKKLNFNNFEAREYDYDELEKGLLSWRDK